MVSTEVAELVADLSSGDVHGLRSVRADRFAKALGMTGVAVSVLTPDAAGELIWHTDGLSVLLDDLELTLGEGPAVDAAAFGEPVFEPDLAAAPAGRWPVFTPAALELGARAVFAVPLLIGAIRIGVISVYRDTPGPLPDGVLNDLLACADAVIVAILGPPAHGQEVPAWLSSQPSGFTAQVHQATGMVSVQLAVSQADALIRLRGYAFSQRRALAEVAADVVARRLRFDKDDD